MADMENGPNAMDVPDQGPMTKEEFIRTELPDGLDVFFRQILEGHYTDSTHDELCRLADAVQALYTEYEAEMNGGSAHDPDDGGIAWFYTQHLL
jgi:hypothetical protein